MKGWVVDVAFRFSIGCDDGKPSDKEIKTHLVRRLNAGGIQAQNLRIVRGKDQESEFIDLAGVERQYQGKRKRKV